MLYVDYLFEILENGTVIFDKKIEEITGAKDGDEYILRQSETGRWVFQRKTQ